MHRARACPLCTGRFRQVQRLVMARFSGLHLRIAGCDGGHIAVRFCTMNRRPREMQACCILFSYKLGGYEFSGTILEFSPRFLPLERSSCPDPYPHCRNTQRSPPRLIAKDTKSQGGSGGVLLRIVNRTVLPHLTLALAPASSIAHVIMRHHPSSRLFGAISRSLRRSTRSAIRNGMVTGDP